MSQPIFSSLGVNYTWREVWTAVVSLMPGSSDATGPLLQLARELESLFGGRAVLTYKGRDALELAVRALGLKHGDQVISQAFACFAVEQGIRRAGAEVQYVDVAPGKTYPEVAQLSAALKRAPRAKAVLLQHTLGVPGPDREIRAWCAEHSLLVIEDLAQAFGSTDAQGELLGTEADAVVCSFGRDKVLDAVTGGAVVVSAPAAQENLKKFETTLEEPPAGAVVRDALYPLITLLIRSTFSLGLGKLLLLAARKLNLISSPLYSPTDTPTQMPGFAARLAVRQLQGLQEQLEHRRWVAEQYLASGLNSRSGKIKALLSDTSTHNSQGSMLRFPVQVELPLEDFLERAKEQQIFISDRWYRAAVDCSTVQCETQYASGSCPEAERLARCIVTLPTHRGIDAAAVDRIRTLVESF